MTALEELFGIPAERFVADHWPARACWCAGSPARLHGGAVLDEAWAAAVRDRLVEELALGFAAHAITHRLDAAAAGTAVGKRFEGHELIVVQLAGRTSWQVAPRTAITDPLAPHRAGGPIHPLNGHADPAALGVVEMPADAETHVLEPGAAGFLPRGTWYATRVLADARVAWFELRVPSWLELLVNTAMTELGAELAWRDTAGAGADLDATVEQALAELRALTPPRRG